ncbi:MAG: FKBP-type peptidyl-prolyl cis-trans isomerase [Janthinobacterium lividum]
MQFSFRPRAARQLALAAGVLSIASLLSSCNKSAEFVKSKSGFEYKIFKKANGKYEYREVASTDDPTYKDRVGKFLLAHVEYRTGKDSVLQSSRKQLQNHAVPLPLQLVTKKGGQEEAFAMLQPGDSAIFRFRTDSLFKGSPVPPELKRGGGFLVMQVVVNKVVSKEEVAAIQTELEPLIQAEKIRAQRKQKGYAEQLKGIKDTQAKLMATPAVAAQLKKDDAVLQAYLKANNLSNAQRTPEGVYYIVTQPSTGPKPTDGQIVSVQYRGTTLDGKEFDSSAKHGAQPFLFALGQYQVIPGWDLGIMQLNKGSKATLLIPSSLAYGDRGVPAQAPGSPPSIAPNSPLRFDVELTDIQPID